MKTHNTPRIQPHLVARTALAAFLSVTFVHAGSTLAQISVQTNEHIYTVQNGDTLQSIATLMTQDSDWRLIKSYNQLQSNSPKPGSTLRIPVGWLKDVRGTATVKAASGAVESDGKAVKAGALLTEKSVLSTGKDGSAVVEFNDGSTVAVTPQSRVELAEMRQSPDKTIVSNGLRLIAGQVTSLVKKLKGRSDYRVYTATATAGVRGTAFRVSVDGAAGSEGGPSEAGTRGNVVGIGVDGFDELQVVTQAEVEGEARGDLPFVLEVKAEVGIGLRAGEIAECLGESGGVISSR